MRLFLSYNSRNKDIVTLIADRLTQKGFTVFFDKYNLQGGNNWIAEIEEAIIESNAALIFISEKGAGHWQNKEILFILDRAAETKGYKFLPIFYSKENYGTHSNFYLKQGKQYLKYPWIKIFTEGVAGFPKGSA